MKIPPSEPTSQYPWVEGGGVVGGGVGWTNDDTTEVDGARLELPEYEASTDAVGTTDEVQVPTPADNVATQSSVAPLKKETAPVGTPKFEATAAW
ncbi:MAG TPA: hypothetical protein VHT49_00360 [Acidimicrobiales bacterium]|nr:hypothetical protein [Acidimicrobiales bacterium]